MLVFASDAELSLPMEICYCAKVVASLANGVHAVSWSCSQLLRTLNVSFSGVMQGDSRAWIYRQCLVYPWSVRPADFRKRVLGTKTLALTSNLKP